MTRKKKSKEEETVSLDDKELMYSLYTKQSGLLPKSFLECTGGCEAGRRFLISDQRLIIGRSSNSNIRLKDQRVSAKHALIFKENDEYTLEDLGSANGVFVNGKRIKRSVVLAHNDEVRIGQCVFNVKLSK